MYSTEEEIIKGCIRRKRKAQKMLYDKYYRRMLGISLRYCSDRAEAEDVMLNGFMHIFSKIGTYERKGSFEGWMKRIMVNTAIDNFRKNKKHLYHTDIIEVEDELISEDSFPANITVNEIMSMVQQLPTGYRVVFNLFAIEGYEHKEIAEMLSVSVNTSKTQLFKARKLLQKSIDNFNKDQR
ncbi:MAG: sigma-70 family RNA polymerase sigma factor [Bacteroidales bacterium]|nr:sigma-70 family RNA polymerase sigma factor [Bacteroidales bacterium]